MKKKLLITVKTYPYPHPDYQETVCTAAVDENGGWYRLYPIPYRKLPFKDQYKRWDWIEADIERNPEDFRPETHHLTNIANEIQIVGRIDSKSWDVRKDLVLKKVYTNLEVLIKDAKDECRLTSLAVFKPASLSVWIRNDAREWDTKQLAKLKQMDIFSDNGYQPIYKVPYRFGYRITDDAGKKADYGILDWEIGMLYWNSLTQAIGDETKACQKVKDKLEMFIKQKDLYLFLGTMMQNHRRFPNPFSIIGLFYPPHDDQITISLS